MSNDSGSLKGKTVLVTRPLERSRMLCSLIEAEGGRAIFFPTLEIINNNASPYIDKVDSFDWIIFISRSAVIKGLPLLFEREHNQRARVAAIGQGTAAELNVHGISPVIYAATGGTDNFLALPEFSHSKLVGKQILLVKGEGGRQTLQATLKNQGATLHIFEVYRRVLPKYSQKFISQIWSHNPPQFCVVTSNQGLENLVSLTSAQFQAQLYQSVLVIFSERARVLAKELGFVRQAVVVNLRSDIGLLQGLQQAVCLS